MLQRPLDRRPPSATIRQVNRLVFHFVLLAAWLLPIGAGFAQTAPTRPEAGASEEPTSIRVLLLTIGPGDEVFELFGHNALVVSDPASGFEAAYNWGVFDFNQSDFVTRFIRGRMLYRLEALDLGRSIAEYRQGQRDAKLTELNLSPAQKRRLLQLCVANDTDANREYTYNYYTDNCSTRVRDMLNAATGNQIAEQLKTQPADPPTTLRWHTARIASQAPWFYLVVSIFMGADLDRPLSKWEESFLPKYLQKHLGEVSVTWADGSVHPILGGSFVVAESGGRVEPAGPPSWGWMFLLAGLAYGAAVLFASRIGRNATNSLRTGGRWVGWVGLPWAGLCVGLGVVATVGWFFTDHTGTRNNVNWLQLSPLSLPILVVMVLLVWGRWPSWAVAAAALPVVLSAVGVAVMLALDQMKSPVLLFALPAHMGVLAAVVRLKGRSRRTVT